MQCVILAAGKGTRMMPLTAHTPKPLLQVAGKTLLDHIVTALPDCVTELVLVVGYEADQIKNHCGDVFHGRPVTYVEQPDCAAGTGDALLRAKPAISGKFLFMYADDIHGSEALELVTKLEHGMLGMPSETPERFGVLVLNEDGTLKEIIEKPANPPSNLVNIGGFVVEPDLLDFVPPQSESGELYVTDMLTEYARHHPVTVIEQSVWIPVGYPDDIEKAEKILRQQ